MTKADLLRLLENTNDDTKIIIYDGDDSTFTLEAYGREPNEVWLQVVFDTTVEDLDD